MNLAIKIVDFYNSGKSIQEIAKKLDVPMDIVEGIIGKCRNENL